MNQYTPPKDLNYQEINKVINKKTYENIIDYAIDLGITNAFCQIDGTQSESFIPKFDLEGVEEENSFDNNNSLKEKKIFYYSNKFDNNDYFALKNNLNGSSNSYFLIKGKKKFLPKEDIESMDAIIAMNRYKFKGNKFNYINSENFQSIPLI